MSPKRSVKLPRAPRNRHRERIQLADLIDQYGSPVDFPCEMCFFSATLCVVMDSKSLKCSACVRNDCPCEKRVFSDKEWGSLRKEESRVSSALTARDFDLVLLQEEINKAQKRLSSLQQVMVRKLREHSQLRKTQDSLKERGRLMLLHDSTILELEDPQLAAVHDDPS
jgi:hypothetical protein